MLLVDGRWNHFFRTGECHKKNTHCGNPIYRHCNKITLRFISSAKKPHQRLRNGHYNRRPGHCTDHPCGNQDISLMDIRSKPRHDCIQRYVYNRICCAKKAVRHIRPYQLSSASNIRNIKSQKCKDCKRHGTHQKVRSPLAPFRIRPIYYQPHSRIRECINKFCHQHHCSCRSSCNAKHIRIKNHKIGCHRAENQVAPKIPDSISDAFSPFSHTILLSLTSPLLLLRIFQWQALLYNAA